MLQIKSNENNTVHLLECLEPGSGLYLKDPEGRVVAKVYFSPPKDLTLMHLEICRGVAITTDPLDAMTKEVNRLFPEE